MQQVLHAQVDRRVGIGVRRLLSTLSATAGAAEPPTTMDEAASEIAAAVTASPLILPPTSRWTAGSLLLGRGEGQPSGQASRLGADMTLRASDRDPSADPGVDFYRFANGGWLDANPIPAGYGSWGSFEEVSRRNEVVLRELLERAEAEPEDELDRLLGDAFAAGLDLDAIEAAGIEPIAPLLRAIAGAAGHDERARAAAGAASQRALRAVRLGRDRRSRRLEPQPALARPGARSGCPTARRTSTRAPAAAELRAAYVEHVAAQLAHVGTRAAERRSGRRGAGVRDAPRGAAPARGGAARPRPDAQPLRPRELAALAPGARPAGLPRRARRRRGRERQRREPARCSQACTTIVADTAPATLRAYLTFTVVQRRRRRAARAHRRRGLRVLRPADPRPAGAARAHQARDRRDRRGPRRGARAALRRTQLPAGGQGTGGAHGRGDRRGDARLDPHARVDGRRDARARGGQARRDRASRSATPTAGATGRASRSAAPPTPPTGSTPPASSSTASWRSCREPVDRDEWEMPAHIVNAYYHPTLNEIVVPAGILQPPLFDAEADDAVNFGGIGMVDRARDHARLRRPGPPLRRRRARCASGGRPRTRRASPRSPTGWSTSSTPTPCSTTSTSTAG